MTNRIERIGLTGPIGSGKSYIAALLCERGYRVYDADSQAKRLVQEDRALQKQIVQLLGSEAFSPDGRYNARYVAQRIFGCSSLRLALNGIIHPAVLADFSQWSTQETRETLVFMESALIPTLDCRNLIDKIVVVTAPVDVRAARVAQRDGANAQEVAARMASQGDEASYTAVADYVIANDGSADVELAVATLIAKLQADESGW